MHDRCKYTKKTTLSYCEHQWRTHAPLIMLLVRGLPVRFELPDGSEFSGKIYVAMQSDEARVKIVGDQVLSRELILDNQREIRFDLDGCFGEPPDVEGFEADE